MSAGDKNKKLVADMYDGLNQNKLGLMEAYWKSDMVWEGPAGIGTKRGIDEFEEYREAFIRAFPDKVAFDAVRIAEGDEWVAATGWQTATFTEDWLGIPATGEQVKVRYMDFWRVEEDEDGTRKLSENLVLIDILGVLEQAGYDVNKVLKFVGSKSPEFFEDQD